MKRIFNEDKVPKIALCLVVFFLILWVGVIVYPQTCDVNNRNQSVLEQNGAGVADRIRFCIKNTSDNYEFTYIPSTATGGGDTIVKKTAQQVSTQTALENLNDLTFNVLASTDYAWDAIILYGSSESSTGIRLSAKIPASVTLIAYTCDIPAAADGVGGAFQAWGTMDDDASLCASATPNNAGMIFTAHCYGVLRNGINAGSFQMRFSSEVALKGVYVEAGSILKYRIY